MTRSDPPATPLSDVEALNALLLTLFPGSRPATMARVMEIDAERARLTQTLREDMLRPGPLVSGPSLMSMADVAAYALILGRLGPVAMAVTSSLTIHFLRGAGPADLQAEARFLHLGRRMAVIEIDLWTGSREALAARATVTYALPAAA